VSPAAAASVTTFNARERVMRSGVARSSSKMAVYSSYAPERNYLVMQAARLS
jgi:hypothetical protein